MNTKAKIQQLITKSIILTMEQKQKLQDLIPSLDEESLQKLLQILQTEEKSILNMLEEQFKNNPQKSTNLLKEFLILKKESIDEMYNNEEGEIKKREATKLDELDEKLKNM